MTQFLIEFREAHQAFNCTFHIYLSRPRGGSYLLLKLQEQILRVLIVILQQDPLAARQMVAYRFGKHECKAFDQVEILRRLQGREPGMIVRYISPILGMAT